MEGVLGDTGLVNGALAVHDVDAASPSAISTRPTRGASPALRVGHVGGAPRRIYRVRIGSDGGLLAAPASTG